MRHPGRLLARAAAAGLGLAAGAYTAYVMCAWRRYGRPSPPHPRERDALLDRFMPAYDVVDRHRVWVQAPAAITFAAAREIDLQGPLIARLVFRAREVLLNAARDGPARPRGLLAETLALGWGVLEEIPDREIVVGAITKPWEANVRFVPLPSDRFTAFDDPGWVKIVWTLRADPTGQRGSLFRTETRALATDAFARRKFRRYWALLSPGIILIRRAMLGPLRREAERRARSAPPPEMADALDPAGRLRP